MFTGQLLFKFYGDPIINAAKFKSMLLCTTYEKILLPSFFFWVALLTHWSFSMFGNKLVKLKLSVLSFYHR